MYGRTFDQDDIKKFLEQYELQEGVDWKFVIVDLHVDVLLSSNAITVLADAIDIARNS